MPVLKALNQDPFSPVLLSSPPLDVTQEQKDYIKKVLDKACSDSRFAEKAYIAIHLILTGLPVVPPVVNSLNPGSTTIGDPSFDIHVIGTGFTPESVIVFNGFDEPTTYVSATDVSTGVNMDVWLAPATVPVAVRTGDILSDAVNFVFQDSVALLTASKTAPTAAKPVVSAPAVPVKK
jgi:hypothetical protein